MESTCSLASIGEFHRLDWLADLLYLARVDYRIMLRLSLVFVRLRKISLQNHDSYVLFGR